MELNELRDECLRIANEHGFTEATVAEDFALMHSEISEALEDYRDGHLPDESWFEYDEDQSRAEEYPRPHGIPIEMADVIIRVLHFCGKHGVDIEGAVAEKMAYNERRPHKHGKRL